MSQLDRKKAETTYLQFWLGVLVLLGLSLGAWLVNHADSAAWPMIVADVLVLIVIAITGFVVDRRIAIAIERMEDL